MNPPLAGDLGFGTQARPLLWRMGPPWYFVLAEMEPYGCCTFQKPNQAFARWHQYLQELTTNGHPLRGTLLCLRPEQKIHAVI